MCTIFPADLEFMQHMGLLLYRFVIDYHHVSEVPHYTVMQ